jgi:amino acid transporter
MKTNLITMIVPTVFVGAIFIILGAAVSVAVPSDFLGATGYLSSVSSPVVSSLPTPMYWPFMSAILTSSPILVLFIGLGIMANAIQVQFNTAFAFTRLLVTSSLDRVVPEVLGRVNMKYGQPVYAWLLLTVGGIIVFVLGDFTTFTSISTNTYLGTVAAFALVSFAAIIFPFRRPDIYKASPISKWNVGKLPLVSLVGVISFVWNVVMFYYYLEVPAYGLGLYAPSAIFMVATFAACYAYYFIRRTYLNKKGMEIGLAFAEVPPA